MQLAEVKFGDVGRGIARYRPVIGLVAGIVVMGLVLPGPERVARNRFEAGSYTAPAAVFGPGPGGAPVDEEITAAAEAVADSSGSFASPTFTDQSAYASSFTVDADASRPSAEPGDSTTFDSSAPASPPSTSISAIAVESEPLGVRAAGWSSAQAGTPVASSGVPQGSLPVGRRPGFERDKVAFVLLDGTQAVLHLKPHPDTAGQRSPATAQIQVCRITKSGWKAEPAQAPASAPAWDCKVSVQGQRVDDGSWTFDLGVFDDRDDDRGFALIPAGSAVDYQVAFQLS